MLYYQMTVLPDNPVELAEGADVASRPYSPLVLISDSNVASETPEYAASPGAWNVRVVSSVTQWDSHCGTVSNYERKGDVTIAVISAVRIVPALNV